MPLSLRRRHLLERDEWEWRRNSRVFDCHCPVRRSGNAAARAYHNSSTRGDSGIPSAMLNLSSKL